MHLEHPVEAFAVNDRDVGSSSGYLEVSQNIEVTQICLLLEAAQRSLVFQRGELSHRLRAPR
jgi:hypothetical protein